MYINFHGWFTACDWHYIYMLFFFFPTTRSMFTSWCGSCLNYILLNVFYTISFGFVVTLIEKNMVKDGNVTIMMVVTLLLVILISVFLIEQIGTLCSTLTGGVGINGLTSAANGAGGKLAGSLGRVTGTRAFMNGFKSNMSNPFLMLVSHWHQKCNNRLPVAVK